MTPTAPGPTEAPPTFDEEWDTDLGSNDPLGFAGYEPPPGSSESVRTGLVHGPLGDYAVVECDFRRVGGTMGAVAGERIVRAYRRATERRLPAAQVVSTGGARLQEGVIALMQMARTSSALSAHRAAGLMSAGALRSPTTGGVYASWASQADVRTATPEAVIGFGGPRVVEQVTGNLPPSTSHTAESAYRHGLIDALTPVTHQRTWLEQALGVALADPLRAEPGSRLIAVPNSDDAWEVVRTARSLRRPSGLAWASWLTDSWVELRGSDPRVRAGLATLDGRRLVVVAMDRDRSTARPSLPGPSAFRLAQRAAALAGRLGLPLLTLVDTPGADPSPASEADGLALEIARTFESLSALSTVSVSLCVGEGGSGGAMALAHTDRLLVLEDSVFSVIGPEPGAALLYRDSTKAPELARASRITAPDLVRLGFADSSVRADPSAARAAVVRAFERACAGDRDLRTEAATVRALRP